VIGVCDHSDHSDISHTRGISVFIRGERDTTTTSEHLFICLQIDCLKMRTAEALSAQYLEIDSAN